MSKRTCVCLDCRTAKRAEVAYGMVTAFRCSKCSGSLDELGMRRRIPKKDDDKGWKALRVHVAQWKENWESKRTQTGLKVLIKLDREIAAKKRKPADEKLHVKVRKLEFHRRSTAKRHGLT
jgi:hypothetical protein